MKGDMTCNIVGTLGFAPGLTNGGTTPATLTLSGSLSSCTGKGAKHDGVTISSGALVATPVGTVINNCGQVVSGTSPFPKFRAHIDWTTTGGTAVPTKVLFIDSYLFDDVGGTGSLVLGLPTTVKSGSYTLSGSTVAFSNLDSNLPDTTLTALCATGAAGLKTIAFGAGGGTIPAGTVTFEAGV
jgi:hypothetical protein